MPPPTPNKSGKAEKAPSQQESNFDLKSHPNGTYRILLSLSKKKPTHFQIFVISEKSIFCVLSS